MENQINGTPKATFNLNALACDMTALFIEVKYENHYECIYEDSKNVNGLKYKDYIQDEYNALYNKIEAYLESNQNQE
jgi:hypothetical protein